MGRLGPHVVGQRVVVRRVLPGETGPSGGPAMTDVLGVCLRWSDGECVVQPETGPAVTIPLALVVSGKPVPPRPSVRQRVSPREVHRHVASLWPDVTVEPLGDWVLRAAPPIDGRHLRRVNSALAMGDPGLPLAEALARVVAFSERHDRPPLAVVEVGSPEAEALAALGWTPTGLPPVHTQLAPVARTRRALPDPPPDVVVVAEGPRVEVHIGDRARGRAAVDGDWVGLHGVRVAADHRRSGLATGVVAALLEWAAERGATTAWLHVESANAPAVALWEDLGFRTHHDHRYVAPDHPEGR